MPKKLEIQQKKYVDIASNPGKAFDRPVPRDLDVDDTFQIVNDKSALKTMKVMNKVITDDGIIVCSGGVS